MNALINKMLFAAVAAMALIFSTAVYSHSAFPDASAGGEGDCQLNVSVISNAEGILILQASDFPDNAQVHWEQNGVIVNIGEVTTFILEPGINAICAYYETPECPEGVFWCETWTVEGGNDCPGEEDFYAGSVEGSCTSWIFEIGEFVEGEEVFWEYGDGTWEWGGHFTDHLYQEEGEYEVCAYYHSSLCPDTVILCQTILVECGDNPCELDMEFEQDGDSLLFYPFNYPEGAQISWFVNDDFQGTGDFFSLSIADPGVYQVCAGYETPECPEGVFWCETWTVEENECPFELIVEETEECGCYEFSLNGQWGSQYFWNLGDTVFDGFNESIVHCYEPGNYTVYVQISGSNYPDCEQEPLVQFLEVPDCEEVECELDMEFEQDGDTLLFYPFNYPEGAQISWFVNDDFQGTGDFFSISIADPGVYQVCAGYETPECPEGVFWCETWTVEENECPFELIVEETEECGCYEFSLNGQWGSQYFWNLGDTVFDGFTESIVHCYEPGNYTVYVQISGSNYPDCEQEPVVQFLEVPDCEEAECYWVAFDLATNIPGVSFGLDWDLTDSEGEEWGSGTIEVSGDTTVFTGELCIGAGCYTLEFEAPFPIFPEDFDIDFSSLINPLLPITIESIQNDNPYTVSLQIGLAETCDWTVGVNENALNNMQVYPVPAHEVVNILLEDEIQTDLRIFNVGGQLVLKKSIYQSGPINVGHLPAGIYLLQLQQGNDLKTFSIPVLN